MENPNRDESSVLRSTQNSYSQAFGHWKSVFEQLTVTLDSFLAESINLDSILKQRDAQTWGYLEATLMHIDGVYKSLETRCSQVQKARAVLGTIRNRSRSLAPLNMLPIETVYRILRYAGADCINDREDPQSLRGCTPSPLQNLLITSKYFREVSIGRPSLWTHIDLALDNKLSRPYMRHAKSCLRYSAQLPLQIHIAENVNLNEKSPVEEVVKLLARCMRHIISLDLRVSISLARSIILGLYRDKPVTHCQLNELFIVDRESDSRWRSPDFYEGFFGHSWNRLSLPNLVMLGIYAPYIPLSSSVYRGLTALKLAPHYTKHTPLRPTLPELLGVLNACPDLRSLSLIGCEFQKLNRSDKIEPVRLSKLVILDVRKTFKEDLIQLLSCISTSSSELALSISFNPEMSETDTNTLSLFILQTNVTRLMLDATRYYGSGGVTWLLQELPTVRDLAVSQYNLNSPPRELFSGLRHLQTLHLIWCPYRPEGLRPALECSSVELVGVNHQQWQFHKLVGSAPRLEWREYPITTHRGVEFEWPVALPFFG
ncbi:F-box-like domain protein [Ceratobasidium sp. AG-Ba]|nr:F-box-like domain protein [Ceratobasidium sp. AG-Ba]